VANLRHKIGKGAEKEVRTFWEERREDSMALATASFVDDDNDSSSSTTTTTTTTTASVPRAPLKSTYLAIAALYTMAVIAMGQQPASMDVSSAGGGVVPFTAQEIWWAARDGYIGDLTSHLFHHGGLVASDVAAGTIGSSSLSPQELMWSVRDGYAGDTLFASGGGGGGGGIESVPFTPQEVWWAIQHGYSYDMVDHWIRNGGLSV